MNERFSRSRSRGRSIARDSSTSRCASVGAKSDCDSAEDGEVSDDEADENLPQDIEEVWFPGKSLVCMLQCKSDQMQVVMQTLEEVGLLMVQKR